MTGGHTSVGREAPWATGQDVSELAQEVGFVGVVRVTSAVWEAIHDVPPYYLGVQSVEDRLWDVLFWAYRAWVGRYDHCTLILHRGDRIGQTLRILAKIQEDGEPVTVIALLEEFTGSVQN